MSADEQQQRAVYIDCIRKQLEELDMLSSIYCSPGDMHIFDASVVSDFNEFLQLPNANPASLLKSHLDYTITVRVPNGKSMEKLDIRFELPHLYPVLENAIVIIHSPLLSKSKEIYFKAQIEAYINTLEKNETYVFQVISWIQDQIDDVIKRDTSEFETMTTEPNKDLVDFERLWIYSHHIRSKEKRHEILRQSRNLSLSGFCRPGKPGIICVEGLRRNTQEFWQIIRSMHWKKISICKSEVSTKPWDKIDRMRRFDGFKEQLFCDVDEQEGDVTESSVMDMAHFIKYLESHNSGYMKKELFDLD